MHIEAAVKRDSLAAGTAPFFTDINILQGIGTAWIAGRRVAGGAGANVDQSVGLTRLEVPGLAALQKVLPAKVASEMIRSVGDLLRAASVDGNSAGRVAEERFGVLQQDGAPTLPDNIADLTRRLDPTGAGVAVTR